MSIRVVRPGLLATIQDTGRLGFQKYGVVVGGAMDSFSHRIASLLAGNKEMEATIEVTLSGTRLEWEQDTVIAVTGGDLRPEINGEPVPMWRPVLVRKGSLLTFNACRSGCRTYVAVHGGFRIEQVMNSKSTYVRGGIGGYNGRALKEGDIIEFQQADQSQHPLFKQLSQNKEAAFSSVQWYVPSHTVLWKNTIRTMAGPEAHLFSEESCAAFFKQSFRISPQSDRMGYRLSGPELSLKETAEMLSEAVAEGTVQVPQDGNPIVLLADRQTTGGYPRIAQIAAADLPTVGQLKPGETIQFEHVTVAEATSLLLEQEQFIQGVKRGLFTKGYRPLLCANQQGEQHE